MEVCPVGPEYNTAEWLTNGRTPDELNKGSHWWKGSPILYQPLDDWGRKFGLHKEEPLPEEDLWHNCCHSTTDFHPL